MPSNVKRKLAAAAVSTVEQHRTGVEQAGVGVDGGASVGSPTTERFMATAVCLAKRAARQSRKLKRMFELTSSLKERGCKRMIQFDSLQTRWMREMWVVKSIFCIAQSVLLVKGLQAPAASFSRPVHAREINTEICHEIRGICSRYEMYSTEQYFRAQNCQKRVTGREEERRVTWAALSLNNILETAHITAINPIKLTRCRRTHVSCS